MGLRDIDFDSALRRLADRKVEEAIREGKFDNLPGRGQPLNLDPMPAEEHARMRWWALRLLKQNDVTPDEVRLRKQIEAMKEELGRTTRSARVRALVEAINGMVRQLNTLGTNALSAPVAPVDLASAMARLTDQPAAPDGPVHHCSTPGCESRISAGARFCRRCGAEIRTVR